VWSVRVQSGDFDVGQEIALIRSRSSQIGAIASFIGLVRDVNDDTKVTSMTLEHYPGMTEDALTGIVEEAHSRWNVLGCTVIHRIGKLEPSDQIVLVIVASGHRGDAFAACEFIMDYLKTRAPFWKKELTPGGERWVETRDSDDDAVSRWHSPHGE
jgi:molybdopterin synthase catalytic subunit